MVYKKISVLDISDGKVELLEALLPELGIYGYEVIDDKPVYNPFDQDYEELKPEIKNRNGLSSVIFYLEDTEDETVIIDEIHKALGKTEIKVSASDETDWRDKWKEYFHPFTIGDILIKPSWEDAEIKEGQKVIEIDPGISFGTGAHETTRMCIEALSKVSLNGKKVLDAGCGSGILSIAASKLGSKDITCLDIDPDCIKTSKENILKNNCEISDFTFLTGDITCDDNLYNSMTDYGYDIIVANILADIIVMMLPRLKTKLKKGGVIITSGIIAGKENLVKSAMEKEGLTPVEIKPDGEWFMVMGKI